MPLQLQPPKFAECLQVAEAKQEALKPCVEALAAAIHKFPEASPAAVRAQKLLLQMSGHTRKVSMLAGACSPTQQSGPKQEGC